MLESDGEKAKACAVKLILKTAVTLKVYTALIECEELSSVFIYRAGQ